MHREAYLWAAGDHGLQIVCTHDHHNRSVRRGGSYPIGCTSHARGLWRNESCSKRGNRCKCRSKTEATAGNALKCLGDLTARGTRMTCAVVRVTS